MEAICFSETLAYFKTIRYYSIEDHILQSNRCETVSTNIIPMLVAYICYQSMFVGSQIRRLNPDDTPRDQSSVSDDFM
jgi:hypothetical protein